MTRERDRQQDHLPILPLFQFIDAGSITDAAEKLHCNERNLRTMWVEKSLSIDRAERFAIELDVHPAVIWDDYNALAAGPTTASLLRQPKQRAMTEEQLRAALKRIGETCGWLVNNTFESRQARNGFPSLFFVHETAGDMLAVQVKAARGKVTPPEQRWLDVFSRAGVRSEVWRPRDLDGATETLTEPMRRFATCPPSTNLDPEQPSPALMPVGSGEHASRAA